MAVVQRKLKVENAVALIFSLHRWGNRKSVDNKALKLDKEGADKNLFNLTKNLIDPKGEIREVKLFMWTEVKSWIIRQSVPSFFQDGVYLFNIRQVEEVETFLRGKEEELRGKVEAFLKIYPQKIKDVEKRLGEHFNPADYPTVKELRNRFRFSWQWVEFEVPKGLPNKIFQAEKKKAEAMWSSAAEMIAQTLREAFRKLVAHAAEVLETDSEGRTKKFKDATFENITEFINTFKNRNLTNDSELETLVKKAQEVMKRIDDPQDLKRDVDMRKVVEKQFKGITKTLDKMIEIKPRRKFSFDD